MGFANSNKQGDTTKNVIGIYRWVEEQKKGIELRNINPVVWSEQNQERLVMNMTTTDSVYHQGVQHRPSWHVSDWGRDLVLETWSLVVSGSLFSTYTGWWYTYPSEKYKSQLGWLFPIYGKSWKFIFQTTNQYTSKYIYIYKRSIWGSFVPPNAVVSSSEVLWINIKWRTSPVNRTKCQWVFED